MCPIVNVVKDVRQGRRGHLTHIAVPFVVPSLLIQRESKESGRAALVVASYALS